MERFCLIGLLLFLCTQAGAQRNFAERIMQQNAERKYGDSGAGKKSDWIRNNLLNTPTEQEYIFPLSMTMHTVSYKNGEQQSAADMVYYFQFTRNHVGVRTSASRKKQNQDLLVIYDYPNHNIITLDVKEFRGMAINLDAFMGDTIARKNIEEVSAKKGVECQPTGKTKTIHGYSCREYLCTDEDRRTHSNIWIAFKVPVDMARISIHGPLAGCFPDINDMTGMLMEGSFYRNDVLELTVQVVNVDKAANYRIDMKLYELNR